MPDRDAQIAELLRGAVDLHCHSGPSAFPRSLDHAEAFAQAEAAGFRAFVTKDHFYPGMAHAALLQTLNPEAQVRAYSGVVLNNAMGGINPFAVDHVVKLGGKIVWMPTFSAANHIEQSKTSLKNYPKSDTPRLEQTPLSVLGEDGKLTEAAQQVLDIIADGDIILASGHLHVSELMVLYPEAKRRGVRKMLVNHPSYIIGCSEDDMRELAKIGVFMEHAVCTMIDCRARKKPPEFYTGLIRAVGVEQSFLGSDLGLVGMPQPVEGFREVIGILLDDGFSESEIRQLTGDGAASLL
ncbi:DUF6282 family protein [Pseudoroseicyclus sp. H15]